MLQEHVKKILKWVFLSFYISEERSDAKLKSLFKWHSVYIIPMDFTLHHKIHYRLDRKSLSL